ncbi:tyrosine-type recombinase/integrase [Polynucleobacter sinensis]|uniref:tyrosine-type recombinase/integrase n=1 Tax=Polynucleobacter sinensis TaxID=1743157 RepID=UPI00078162E4|nr:site-specific integrase [Polynucleobacter sinensis]
MAQARTLTDAELDKALAYAQTTKAAVRNRAILLLTHLAGMRIGEVAGVRYCDVLSSDKQVLSEIHLRAYQTKGNKSRVVILSERMQAELTQYIAKYPPKILTNPLFPTQRSSGFTPNTLTHVINGLYRQAGLNGATSHSGRRGFLTRLSEKGVSVRVMMQLAGHSQMSTTQRYIDTRPDILRNAVELI